MFCNVRRKTYHTCQFDPNSSREVVLVHVALNDVALNESMQSGNVMAMLSYDSNMLIVIFRLDWHGDVSILWESRML
jgi:hypothetical protein